MHVNIKSSNYPSKPTRVAKCTKLRTTITVLYFHEFSSVSYISVLRCRRYDSFSVRISSRIKFILHVYVYPNLPIMVRFFRPVYWFKCLKKKKKLAVYWVQRKNIKLFFSQKWRIHNAWYQTCCNVIFLDRIPSADRCPLNRIGVNKRSTHNQCFCEWALFGIDDHMLIFMSCDEYWWLSMNVNDH